MRFSIGWLLFIGAAALCAGAQAACGGGGYKPQPRESRPHVREERSPVQYRQVNTVNVNMVSFDTGRYDSMNGRLNLSEKQQRQVSKAKSEISARLDSLKRERDSAQANLANCRGSCDSERRKLDEATARLNAYDANVEFNRRLANTLSDSQMRIYNSGG